MLFLLLSGQPLPKPTLNGSALHDWIHRCAEPGYFNFLFWRRATAEIASSLDLLLNRIMTVKCRGVEILRCSRSSNRREINLAVLDDIYIWVNPATDAGFLCLAYTPYKHKQNDGGLVIFDMKVMDGCAFLIYWSNARILRCEPGICCLKLREHPSSPYQTLFTLMQDSSGFPF